VALRCRELHREKKWDEDGFPTIAKLACNKDWVRPTSKPQSTLLGGRRSKQKIPEQDSLLVGFVPFIGFVPLLAYFLVSSSEETTYILINSGLSILWTVEQPA
jgi:VIT1/CCC1 family predicted Fe2+/Mn2+ transporter